MSHIRLRRIAAIAASTTAAFALSACGTGFGAQTDQMYDAGVGSNHRDGTIYVLNALFVDNGDDTATFSAGILNKDTETHTLTSAVVTDSAGNPIEAAVSEPSEIEPRTLFTTGEQGEIILTGDFPAGGFATITLEFDGAAPVTIDAPVVERDAMYSSVAQNAAADPAEQTAAEQLAQEEPAE